MHLSWWISGLVLISVADISFGAVNWRDFDWRTDLSGNGNNNGNGNSDGGNHGNGVGNNNIPGNHIGNGFNNKGKENGQRNVGYNNGNNNDGHGNGNDNYGDNNGNNNGGSNNGNGNHGGSNGNNNGRGNGPYVPPVIPRPNPVTTGHKGPRPTLKPVMTPRSRVRPSLPDTTPTPRFTRPTSRRLYWRGRTYRPHTTISAEDNTDDEFLIFPTTPEPRRTTRSYYHYKYQPNYSWRDHARRYYNQYNYNGHNEYPSWLNW